MISAAGLSPLEWILIALGSALGGVLRFWLGGLFGTGLGERFPLGTLVVNVSGCLMIGLMLAALDSLPTGSAPAELMALGVTGLLGSYTTVSSFSLQTLQLAEDGDRRGALLNVALSLVGCLAATGLGLAVGRGLAAA